MMAFIGVRISWLMFARNSLLDALRPRRPLRLAQFLLLPEALGNIVTEGGR